MRVGEELVDLLDSLDHGGGLTGAGGANNNVQDSRQLLTVFLCRPVLAADDGGGGGGGAVINKAAEEEVGEGRQDLPPGAGVFVTITFHWKFI